MKVRVPTRFRPRPGARARAAAAANTSGRMIAVGVAFAVFALLGTRSLSYLAFAAIALAPTFAAAIIEKPGRRSATISIGSLTVATLMPLILGAIANGSTRNLLSSGTAWTFIAGAVVGGIAIYFVLPTATLLLDDMRANARLRALRAQQGKLEQDWGTEVRGTVAS